MHNRVLSEHFEIWLLGVGLISFVLFIFIVRHLTRRASEAEAKTARLAREAGALNDDLLQSLQAVLLTFHLAAQHASHDHAVKQLIERTFDAADRAVVEGRDRFQALRLRPQGKGPGRRLKSDPPGER